MANAQDSLRMVRSIRRLCSGDMAGRGYSYRGDRLAALFLDEEFRRAGLRPAGRSFLQEFPLTQNLFPGRPSLRLNGRKLRPGRDFIPGPANFSLRGRFRIDSLPEKAGGQALLLRGKKEFRLKPGQPVPALILRSSPKLTHSLANEQKGIPEIIIPDTLLKSKDTLIRISVRAKMKKLNSFNVMGMVKGSVRPDSFLVLCAHYDHLGSFGKRVWFPGANDNASGVAMLLELAHEIARNPLRYSVLFVAFSGEEAGLIGSTFMAENPPVPLENIRFLFNLDLLGFGEKGATVVNATIHPVEFERLKALNQTLSSLPELKPRGKAANSDHHPFTEKGVPAFFMYLMGGPGHYHDVHDKPETLSMKGMRGSFRLILGFLKGF